MSVRRVDIDHRRRLLVERQQLGSAGRATRRIDDVTGALALLHSTDPATPHLMLHARTDASVEDIDDTFYGRRSLVRHTCLRRTVFAMPHDVARLAHASVNADLVAKLRRQLTAWVEASDDELLRRAPGAPRASGAEFVERVEELVVARLVAGGAATGSQLAADIDELRVRFDPMPGKAYSKPQRITSKVLEILAADGRIARAAPTGADFTSGAWTWAASDVWFGGAAALGSGDLAPADATAALLDRHLASFGPATVTDLTWWAGLSKSKVRAALTAIDASSVELDGSEEEGFVRRDDDLEPTAGAGSSRRGAPSVAFLPGLDSTTMGWKQRAWYVDDTPGAGIFDKNGNAGPTIWLDGRVVGVWSQRPDGSVAWTLTEAPGRHERDADDLIAAEAERLAAWLGAVRVKWRYPTPMSRSLV